MLLSRGSIFGGPIRDRYCERLGRVTRRRWYKNTFTQNAKKLLHFSDYLIGFIVFYPESIGITAIYDPYTMLPALTSSETWMGGIAKHFITTIIHSVAAREERNSLIGFCTVHLTYVTGSLVALVFVEARHIGVQL